MTFGQSDSSATTGGLEMIDTIDNKVPYSESTVRKMHEIMHDLFALGYTYPEDRKLLYAARDLVSVVLQAHEGEPFIRPTE